jgi:hypothetical protein
MDNVQLRNCPVSNRRNGDSLRQSGLLGGTAVQVGTYFRRHETLDLLATKGVSEETNPP